MLTKILPAGNLFEYLESDFDSMGDPREQPPVMIRGDRAVASRLVAAQAPYDLKPSGWERPGWFQPPKRKRADAEFIRHSQRHLVHVISCFHETQADVEKNLDLIVPATEQLFLAGLPRSALHFTWYLHRQKIGTHVHAGLVQTVLPGGMPYVPRLDSKLRLSFDRLVSHCLGLADPMDPEGIRVLKAGRGSWKGPNKEIIGRVCEKVHHLWKTGGEGPTHGEFLKLLEDSEDLKDYGLQLVMIPDENGRPKPTSHANRDRRIPRYHNTVVVRVESPERYICFVGPICRRDFNADLWRRRVKRREKELGKEGHFQGVFDEFKALWELRSRAQAKTYGRSAGDGDVVTLEESRWLEPGSVEWKNMRRVRKVERPDTEKPGAKMDWGDRHCAFVEEWETISQDIADPGCTPLREWIEDEMSRLPEEALLDSEMPDESEAGTLVEGETLDFQKGSSQKEQVIGSKPGETQTVEPVQESEPGSCLQESGGPESREDSSQEKEKSKIGETEGLEKPAGSPPASKPEPAKRIEPPVNGEQGQAVPPAEEQSAEAEDVGQRREDPDEGLDNQRSSTPAVPASHDEAPVGNGGAGGENREPAGQEEGGIANPPHQSSPAEQVIDSKPCETQTVEPVQESEPGSCLPESGGPEFLEDSSREKEKSKIGETEGLEKPAGSPPASPNLKETAPLQEGQTGCGDLGTPPVSPAGETSESNDSQEPEPETSGILPDECTQEPGSKPEPAEKIEPPVNGGQGQAVPPAEEQSAKAEDVGQRREDPNEGLDNQRSSTPPVPASHDEAPVGNGGAGGENREPAGQEEGGIANPPHQSSPAEQVIDSKPGETQTVESVQEVEPQTISGPDVSASENGTAAEQGGEDVNVDHRGPAEERGIETANPPKESLPQEAVVVPEKTKPRVPFEADALGHPDPEPVRSVQSQATKILGTVIGVGRGLVGRAAAKFLGRESRPRQMGAAPSRSSSPENPKFQRDTPPPLSDQKPGGFIGPSSDSGGHGSQQRTRQSLQEAPQTPAKPEQPQIKPASEANGKGENRCWPTQAAEDVASTGAAGRENRIEQEVSKQSKSANSTAQPIITGLTMPGRGGTEQKIRKSRRKLQHRIRRKNAMDLEIALAKRSQLRKEPVQGFDI